MTRPCDERPPLDRTEEQFVARLAAHYTPTPMSPARRHAWEEALWARLQRPRRRMWLAPALTAIGVAVVVGWLTLPRLFMPMPGGGGEPHISAVERPSLAQSEYELIYPHALTDASERDDSAILPDDYRMIAEVFLDQ
jgi:hypothetical protein